MTASPGALKIVSLVTLTAQNSLLTIILHYSRISVGPSEMYSAASAVLLNELLKMLVSLTVSLTKAIRAQPSSASLITNGAVGDVKHRTNTDTNESWSDIWEPGRIYRGAVWLAGDVLSSDCWKLSIPACLYVVQNNLQFVAASNLDAPTFQVSYNLKILTTALCSVLMMGRRLSGRKWLALTLLAVGVATVQLQSFSGRETHTKGAEMNSVKGLSAVLCACVTSGLAGVYFEMVLKGSKTDLWTRNVQLSIFSIVPAVFPVFFPGFSSIFTAVPLEGPRQAVFANFGFWAWAVVLTQVVGGLTTALVIKYADNIVKGFATSLAIIISSLFSFLLFDFQITITFVIGAAIVVGATWMYNSTPPPSPPPLSPTVKHPSTLMNAQRRSVSPGGTGPLPVNSSVQYRPGDPPPAYRRPPNTSAQTPDAFIPSFDHRIEVVDSQASPSLGGLDGFDGFSARKL